MAEKTPKAEDATPAPLVENGIANTPVPFDAELCAKLAKLLRERHTHHVGQDEVITISGEVAQGHALVLVELRKKDDTFRLSFETCVECDPNGIENPFTARDYAVDYADIVLEKFFALERMLHFQPLWQTYSLDKIQVLMRGEIVNPALESEADSFLAEHGFDPDGGEK